MQETIIAQGKIWENKYYLQCCICQEKTDLLSESSEVLTWARGKCWFNKQFYQDLLTYEDWYCSSCSVKANEGRDTIPDI